jgi:hypothetical protein
MNLAVLLDDLCGFTGGAGVCHADERFTCYRPASGSPYGDGVRTDGGAASEQNKNKNVSHDEIIA